MQFQILVASSLLLAAGCANNERYATYDDSISPAGTGYAAGGGTSATAKSYAQPESRSSSYSYQENAPATVGSQERSQPAPAEGATADATLTAQVQAALYNDSTLASVAPRIQVAARDGRVTLKGTVSSEQQRRDIETRVQATSGVVAVNNQLQISPEPTGRGESSHIYSNATSRASSAVGAAEPPGGRLYSNGSSANADMSATSSGGAARQYESSQSPTPQTSGALNPEERK
ncbi:MAG TPA: BON domain-containing protein, partial [Verrucomicrobiae bacterium]|nr:BON domain-containing protein [Verrucomicrobiae bacterium]